MSPRVRPLKVVYMSHVARLSGAEIGLARFLEAADEIEATVLLAEDGELVDPLRETGARVEILPLDEGARSLKRGELQPGVAQARAAREVAAYARRLSKRLRSLDPDIVHTNSLKSGVYGTAAARMAQLPVVWHLHDRLAPDYLPPAAVWPMRLLASSAPSALVVPSRYTLQTVGRYRRPSLRAAVIPFPVPMPERSHEVRDEVRTVGIVGRLTPWKGQHVFLDAFAQAFPSGDVRARVIGDAMFGEVDYEQALKEQALRLGVADRVDFAGFTPDVPQELARLDVLVHSSVLADPLTTVVLEGMAAGLPVISASEGGHAEHVRDGHEGLLHAPGDAAALAGAMARAANSHALRIALSRAGRAKAVEFAPEAVVGQMRELYDLVLSDRRGAT